MIKFARRTNFYWYSPLDPEADAYTAINQQILDTRDKLTNSMPSDMDSTKAFNALNNAAAANEALAKQRRQGVWDSKATRIGAGTGAALLGAGGGYLGYQGAKALGFKGRGQTVGALLGLALGAGVGTAAGGNLGANMYANSPKTDPAKLKNGTDILTKLNKDLDDAYIVPNNAPDSAKTKNFNLIDVDAANKARENARKRREGK